jgi:hypothetical protein
VIQDDRNHCQGPKTVDFRPIKGGWILRLGHLVRTDESLFCPAKAGGEDNCERAKIRDVVRQPRELCGEGVLDGTLIHTSMFSARLI